MPRHPVRPPSIRLNKRTYVYMHVAQSNAIHNNAIAQSDAMHTNATAQPGVQSGMPSLLPAKCEKKHPRALMMTMMVLPERVGPPA